MNDDEYTPWQPEDWEFPIRDASGKVYVFRLIGYAPTAAQARQTCAMHTSTILAVSGVELHPIQDFPENS